MDQYLKLFFFCPKLASKSKCGLKHFDLECCYYNYSEDLHLTIIYYINFPIGVIYIPHLRCRGLVCSVWMWYFLIILTYFLISVSSRDSKIVSTIINKIIDNLVIAKECSFHLVSIHCSLQVNMFLLNLGNSNFNFSKYLPILNKFGTRWVQRIGFVYDLF